MPPLLPKSGAARHAAPFFRRRRRLNMPLAADGLIKLCHAFRTREDDR